MNWSQDALGHMVARHGVFFIHANEAVNDIDALWFDPDPASKSGISVRVIGYSHSIGQVLCVILLPAEGGAPAWDGVNAWPANATYRRLYREGQES